MPGLLRPALLVLFLSAVCAIFIAELSPLWQSGLLMATVLEVAFALYRMHAFRAFTLDRDDAGTYYRDEGCGLMPIASVRWQDFGYLAVLDYTQQGRCRRALWWLPLLPLAQRRQIRLWMNAPVSSDAAEMPSILVNPVL